MDKKRDKAVRIALIHFAVTGLLALAFTMPASAASAYCIGWDKELPNYDPLYYSVSHEFKRAKYVVKAKVVREIWVGEDGKSKPLKPPFQFRSPRPWGFDPYVGAYYDVKVEEAFKGAPQPVIRLFSENSTARFWLRVGSDWVLFITDEKFEDPIGIQPTLDTCGNMRGLPKGRSVLHAVRTLAAVKY